MATGVKLRKKPLEEATVKDMVDAEKKQAKEAEKQMEAGMEEYEKVADSGDMEQAMNRSLNVALRNQRIGKRGSYPNILFTGDAGVGKSGRIRAWAARHNINLFEVRAAGMDDTDLGGAVSPASSNPDSNYADVVRRLSSTEFDDLNEPRSVLFLDELNRAPRGVRTNLLELINSHVVPDARVKGKQRYLENFLFTVSAINPASEDFNTDEFDRAERGRFKEIPVAGDPKITLNYLLHEYDTALSKFNPNDPEDHDVILEFERKKNLAKAILGSKDFIFDSETQLQKDKDTAGYNGKSMQPRDIEAVLDICDGTKEDLLREWNSRCNNLRLPLIKGILKNYTDIDDKANDALKKGTESSVFGKKQDNNYDKLNKLLNDLGA